MTAPPGPALGIDAAGASRPEPVIDLNPATISIGEFNQLDAIRYGGLELGVVSARPVPETADGRPIIVADIAFRNATGPTVRISQRMVSLVAEDGRRIRLNRFEYTDDEQRLLVPSGEIERATLVFKLGPLDFPDLSDFHVEVAELGRHPVALPLDGRAPDPGQLPDVEVFAADREANQDGLRTDVKAVQADRNFGPYRVTADQALLIISATLSGNTAGDTDPDTPNPLDPRYWSLEIGDDTLTASRLSVTGRSEGQSDVTIVFTTPEQVDEAALLAGPFGARRTVATLK